MSGIVDTMVLVAGLASTVALPPIAVALVGTARKNMRLAERNAVQAAMIADLKAAQRVCDAGVVPSTLSGQIEPQTPFHGVPRPVGDEGRVFGA